MTNPSELKDKIGGYTEQIEKKTGELWTNLSPHYTNLEPWKRGLLLISLTLFLLFSIYYLTKKDQPKPRELTETEKKELEKFAEEKILRRAEFLRKLQQH